MGKKQPAHEIKLGKLRVTIWENETEAQDVWFTAVLTRLYKTGNVWKESSTLKHEDLPVAMKAMDLAFRWIWKTRVQLQVAEKNAAGKALANAGR